MTEREGVGRGLDKVVDGGVVVVERQKITELRRDISARKLALKQSKERLKAGMEELEENQAVLERNMQMHQRLFYELNRRKKELIADLFSIYPIEQVSFENPPTTPAAGGKSFWLII